MKAQWLAETETNWLLSGWVDFAEAPSLAAAFEPCSGHKYRLDLAQAQGGAPLLLVLLACCRQARSVGAHLVICHPSDNLKRLLELSDLQDLLPLEAA